MPFTMPLLSSNRISFCFPHPLNFNSDLWIGKRDRIAVSREVSTNLTASVASSPPPDSVRGDSVAGGARDVKKLESEGLELLYDDGYTSSSEIDYTDLVRSDGAPPRWFCPVECGRPIKGSPLLLFLPGIGGLGMGLILHHKALGKVFEVRCMHIPVYDRTPFEGMVKIVEATVRLEHAMCPDKPIYLVGDSFGGCVALAVAAHNPNIDLILILSNPATSFGRSQLQPFLPILEALPDLSFIMGDPAKMAMASVESGLPPLEALDQLPRILSSMLPHLFDFADIMPKDTLLWKLKLLRSAASYANSRLHAVKAEVLVLASGKDNILPSRDEAQRLRNSLRNCRVRYFKDYGHTLLLEDGIRLLTIIKGASMYRRSRRLDYVSDYLPPSMTEYTEIFRLKYRLFFQATSPVMLSTLNDGKIVSGLAGVPNEGPVLLVGYHTLMAFELSPLIDAFLREKNVMGEEYKLFWPEQPEFVRMAARFGATIVPFGVVGEDDIAELVIDYNDQMSIPITRDLIKQTNKGFKRLRTNMNGEVANQDLYIPGILPKIPGRFYFLFGKPFETKGRMGNLRDRENANEVYLQIKSEVESILSYLKKKREEDPYRGILQRIVYQATRGSTDEVPTFEP
ncbi:phytyl ester synthase 1, chloroplastic-like isoform X2 [Tasmannia lanceolata]|uniref:phytyl ester synthase 1, chloroplastic-like isoform X2 n=1 Tax=Tasmannia lanceolata TaxID=3420 RepID=UPI004063FA15